MDLAFAGIEQALNVEDEAHRSYERKRTDVSLREGLMQTHGRRGQRASLCDNVVNKDYLCRKARRGNDGEGSIVLLNSWSLPHPS